MEKITSEMIEKAKGAKTPEELLEMAVKAGLEIDENDAKEYFNMLNPKMGELDDDDLDNVAGGACKSKKSGRTVVTCYCKCFTGCFETLFVDPTQTWLGYKRYDNLGKRDAWNGFASTKNGKCGGCVHLEFEGGTGVCGKT